MQNENTQSTKIMWSIGCTIALLIGLFLFREQWNWILFCLDVRYWPVWTPRLLWILVGLMIINHWATRIFSKQHESCRIKDSPEKTVPTNLDRNVLLSTAKRFVLFLLFIEALRLSGYELRWMFYPFFQAYKYSWGCYSYYFDFGGNAGICPVIDSKTFIPLPVCVLACTFLILILWCCRGRKNGLSLRQYILVLIKRIGNTCLKICRIGLIGQLPVFYIVCGFLLIGFVFIQWGIAAFYRKPLEYYMATGILSWRLFLVPLLIIILLALIAWLFRRKKHVAVWLFVVALLGHSTGFAQDVPNTVSPSVSFNDIPTLYPHAKKLNDQLFLLEKAGMKHRQKSEVDKAVNEESKKADDGGYLANSTAVDCFAAYAYRFTGGRYKNEAITFRLRSPDKIEPGKTYPLILHLHGKGESNDDNERQLAHLQSALESLTGPQSLDCFILSPHCPADNKDWPLSIVSDEKGDAPLVYTKEIIDIVMKTFPIDQDRVSILGVCSGSNAAWDLASQNPDLFCALAATTIGLPASSERLEVLKHLPMWLFNNDNDEASPIEPLYEARDILKEMGASIHLTVRKDGHDSWTKALKNDKVFVWLAAQKKGSFCPPPGVILTHSRTLSEAGWQILLPLVLVLILGLVQRKLTKRLQTNSVQ